MPELPVSPVPNESDISQFECVNSEEMSRWGCISAQGDFRGPRASNLIYTSVAEESKGSGTMVWE